MIFQNIYHYLMILLLFSEKTYYINNVYCILVNPITNRKITAISNNTRHFSGFTDRKIKCITYRIVVSDRSNNIFYYIYV
ncbi:hypothetical protein AKG16_17945 [Morganella morganii]|nr:hypothetical protein AKG16_17945 [Morganella morganii]